MLTFALLLAAGPAAQADAEPSPRTPLVAPRPRARAVDAERVAAAVAALADPDWKAREAASALLARAPAAAGPLRVAAHDPDPERRARAVAALAEGLRLAVARGDTAAALPFNDALTALRTAPLAAPADPLAGPAPAVAEAASAADAALDLFPAALTRLALREVRRLGGAVMRTDPFGGAAFGSPAITYSVTLDDRWAGGERGLRHLRAIRRLTQVHLTDGCPLPDAARAALVAGAYGTFSVERRGRAFLGVSFSPTGGGGCRIDRATPGGPAALAGLRGGDLIVRFGETPIENPAALLDAIRETGELGEATPVTILRADVPLTVPVTLARWPDRTDAPVPARPRLVPLGPPAPLERVPLERVEPVPFDRVPGDGSPAEGGDTED